MRTVNKRSTKCSDDADWSILLYFNAVNGTPDVQMKWDQSKLYIAAGLVSAAQLCSRITPVLYSLAYVTLGLRRVLKYPNTRLILFPILNAAVL